MNSRGESLWTDKKLLFATQPFILLSTAPHILHFHFQNVPSVVSGASQELKKSNLKSQNGEIDYKKVSVMVLATVSLSFNKIKRPWAESIILIDSY